MALWGGRFSSATRDEVALYSESISFDKRLYRHDIEGSKAHVKMLAAQGIIPEATCEAIRAELDNIRRRIEAPFPEAMKHAILFNSCLAVISVRLIEEEIRKGTIHMLQDPENIWDRTFKLVYHKDKFISDSILLLKELLSRYPKPEIPLHRE